jgi:hypothetical protein
MTLTKKDSLSWTLEATQDFEKLKEVMWKDIFLTTPNFTKTFILECENGIGVIMVIGDRLNQVRTLLCTLSSFQIQYSFHRIHGDSSKATWKPKYYCK